MQGGWGWCLLKTPLPFQYSLFLCPRKRCSVLFNVTKAQVPVSSMRPGQFYFHPWGQYGILEARRLAAELDAKARSTGIRDVEFQSEDEDSEYSSSEPSSSVSGDDEATSYEGDQEPIGMDLEVDENELNDLKKDAEVWPEPPSKEEIQAEEERILDEEIVQLEKAEAEAKAAYNPNEVAALMTELLDLFVSMGRFDEGSISRAPHHPPIDLSLARELGYDEGVLELLQKLPYVSSNMYGCEREILPDSHFTKYLKEGALKDGRIYVGYDAYGAVMDPWMVMLVELSNMYGWLVFLDTKLGRFTCSAGVKKMLISDRCDSSVQPI